MTSDISTAIVGVQIALIVLSLAIGLVTRQRRTSVALAWTTTIMAFVAIALAGAAAAPGSAFGISGATSGFVVYAIIAFIAAAIAWGVVAVVGVRMQAVQERFYAKPETRQAISAELREVLRAEGIELDERLARAEQEREQFLFALEDQHARQIRGLADEYQHEASTILRSLIAQLDEEQLRPLADERIAEHASRIERELSAIDADELGRTFAQVREQHEELARELEAASKRVEKLRAKNPSKDADERVEERLAHIDELIEERVAAVTAEIERRVTAQAAALEAKLDDVDAMLASKVSEAGNPLVARMEQAQDAVQQQLDAWLGVLDARFTETEQILNERILGQEQVLEQQVVDLEHRIEDRLAQHVAALEQVLADHDAQLQASLTEQSSAVDTHAAAERDRLALELTEHGVGVQQRLGDELAAAEARARETVEATQAAWNVFTEELEQRFAETREEALRAARDIAEEERASLHAQMQQITTEAASEIGRQVENLGREAAWQRNQVERSVRETLEVIQQRAAAAVQDADNVFADLERIGAERVERIRRDAEDALVQSRDYVGQLQESLAAHLDQLRERSAVVADELNERLAAVTTASSEGVTQLEQYARDLVDGASRELGNVAERATADLQARINHEFTATVASSLDTQQHAFQVHVTEVAQRIMQQVQGDLAGLAEHARGAVTGELEQVIAMSRQQAQEQQEQSFRALVADLARQQAELAEQARSASSDARRILEDGLRESRRQLEESMASMGAHMREELVRFHDEGQRRVDVVIARLRASEQDAIRDEDRKLSAARQELVRQHQGALEDQVRSLVTGLSTSFDAGSAPAGGTFTSGLTRPSTPLSPGGPGSGIVG